MDPVWDTLVEVRTAIEVSSMLYEDAIVCQVTCFSSSSFTLSTPILENDSPSNSKYPSFLF